MAEELEQKIKDYLWFHLSAENKKAFIEYFKHNDHFKTDESQIDQHWLKISNGDKKILRIIPNTTFRAVHVPIGYKFKKGKS
jgi:hypothetical protein